MEDGANQSREAKEREQKPAKMADETETETETEGAGAVMDLDEGRVVNKPKMKTKTWTGEYNWNRAVLCGLENLGNTCYLNSVLQALNNCPMFVDYFYKNWPAAAPPILQVGKRSRHEFVNSFARLMCEMWHGKRKEIRAGNVTKGVIEAVPEFQLYMQQDAMEALIYVLNELHDELSVAVPATYHPARTIIQVLEGEQQEADAYAARKGEQRAERPSGGKAKKNSPKLRQIREPYLQSIVSDTFQSLLAQTCKCSKCGYSSRRLEDYKIISLDIPTKAQLKEMTKKNSSSQPVDDMESGSASQGGPAPHQHQASTGFMKSFGSFVSSAKHVFGLNGHTVALEDCLKAFFATERMEGDEQYDCEKCKSKQDAEKSYSFAHLPEIMCLQLKRFNKSGFLGGLGNQKNTVQVSYPVTGLDLGPYVYRISENTIVRDISHCAMSGSNKYDLFAVVRHSGGINGGHYITNCKNPVNEKWYEFDDEFIRPLTADSLAAPSSDAYLLFYKKVRSDTQQKGHAYMADRVRQEVTASLKRSPTVKDTDASKQAYISRYWITKWGTFANPGSLCNRDVACEHGFMLPSTAKDVNDRVMNVPLKAWEELCDYYGQGTMINAPVACETCTKQLEDIKARRIHEHEEIKVMDNEYHKGDQRTVWYLVHVDWVQAWLNFVKNTPPKIGRGHFLGVLPPGPITNSSLFESDGHTLRQNLRRSQHYRGLNRNVWNFFVKTYGGGPAIVREHVDIYSRPVDEEEIVVEETVDAR